MSTEVIGIFDGQESVENAEKTLRDSGFEKSNIKMQSYSERNETNADHYSQSLQRGQSLIAVTVSDNIEEDKALHLLRQAGAVKINEIEERFHAGTAKS